jgi:hypothetical protein
MHNNWYIHSYVVYLHMQSSKQNLLNYFYCCINLYFCKCITIMTVVLFYSCEELITALHVVHCIFWIPPQSFVLSPCV